MAYNFDSIGNRGNGIFRGPPSYFYGTATGGGPAIWNGPNGVREIRQIIYTAPYLSGIDQSGQDLSLLNHRQVIQDLIDAMPDGGTLMLDAVTYTFDGTPLNITKSITIQGCGHGVTDWASANPTGSILVGIGSQTILTINVNADTTPGRSVTIRGVGFLIGTGGKGITVTGSTRNAGTTLEDIAFVGGAIAVQTTKTYSFRMNKFWALHQTTRSFDFSAGNDDGGTYWIADGHINNAMGATPADWVAEGMRFNDMSSVDIHGVQTLGITTAIHNIFTGAGATSGPSQWHIYGNQFDTGGNTGSAIWWEGSFPSGGLQITGNFLATYASADPTLKFTNTAGNYCADIAIVGNFIESRGGTAVGGLISLDRPLGVVIANNSLQCNGDASCYVINITNSLGSTQVGPNTVINDVSTASFLGTGYVLTQPNSGGITNGLKLANLPSVDNGSSVYCVDAKGPADAGWTAGMIAVGGGTGRMITRDAGQWRA